MYHLTVAAGSSATFKVGTEYEQLIGKLLDAEGDPGEQRSIISDCDGHHDVVLISFEAKHFLTLY